MTVHSLAGPGGSLHIPLEQTGKSDWRRPVPVEQVIHCKSKLDAVFLCMSYDPIRGRDRGYYADHLGIDRSHWSRMLKGKATLGIDEIRLQQICRNLAINQYMNLQADCDTVPHQLTTAEKAARYDALQAQA